MSKYSFNVLSLFDGISCGRIALERANIKVNKYYASEIEPNAIKISQKNYPDIIHIGDVREINCENYKDIDIIIGGSPCQNFSFAGKRKGTTTKEGIEVTTLEQYLDLKEKGFEFEGYSYLFWEYVRILKEIKPKYFLLENVKMAEKWKNIITKTLGIEPIMINSSLVSAQSRERLYWTNIPNIYQPEDKHIYLKDIIEKESNFKYVPKTKLNNIIYKKNYIQWDINGKGHLSQDQRAFYLNGKSGTLDTFCACRSKVQTQQGIRIFTITELEKLQTLPIGYTSNVSNNIRGKLIGNGWTVDVISHIFSFIPKEEK